MKRPTHLKTKLNGSVLLICTSALCFFSFFCSCFAANQFEIDAWAYDRGNCSVFTEQYRNGGPPVIANGGSSPNQVEYDIPFPVSGKYELSLLVAMGDIRSLTVYLDGTKVGTVCQGPANGSWDSIDAVWDRPLVIEIPTVGIHTMKLVAESGPFPHVARLKWQATEEFPESWTLERPHARKLVDPYRDFQDVSQVNPDAVRRAINDLLTTYHENYPNGKAYLDRLDTLLDKAKTVSQEVEAKKLDEEMGKTRLIEIEQQLLALRKEALLTNNPAIDFNELLFIRRSNKSSLGMPMNWESNSSLPKRGYDDEILALSLKSESDEMRSVYKPRRDYMMSDVDLNFDGEKIMFSSIGNNGRWHIFELDLNSKKAKQLTDGDKDVDFYDSCYLPDGRIIITSTAPMVGVPCVFGASHVANLFLLDPQEKTLRQLCFDQEHNWCPTIMPNGRVLYTRWEYTDTPHSNTRLLFHCNPDGTEQFEFYGSNSYWPTSIFQARPIPGQSARVVGVVGGHHDNPRMGELVILDASRGRYETDGAVQRIPGYGEPVERIVADGLTRNSWPKFLHPYPINDKYFVVSAKPTPSSQFGLYLVDVFDNMILIKEWAENSLLEPIPLKVTQRPPMIPDKVDLDRADATIYIPDIYVGRGLQGIPRGEVKELRIYTYHFGYQEMGGLLGSIGQDGPWDVRSVLGTVPVEEDGSALFTIPANLPIAVQPLDKNGQAMQLMRSWMTAMPGELLQCSGCHETQNTAPPIVSQTIALGKAPSSIKPYYPGDVLINDKTRDVAVRGFSFVNEVQPVLDKYCVSCHDGSAEEKVKTAVVQERPVGTALDGQPFAISLRGDQMLKGWTSDISGNVGYIPGVGGKFTVAYDNLQRFVRRSGIESDYEMFLPYEYAANTTELVQLLKKGHYGVELDADSWKRLIAWIDMNAPFHGSWSEMMGKDRVEHIAKRRVDLLKLYGGAVVDFESGELPQMSKAEPSGPKLARSPDSGLDPKRLESRISKSPHWPRSLEKMQKDQLDSVGGDSARLVKTISLGKDQRGNARQIELTRIPAGEFVNQNGTVCTIDKPFWLGKFEITNEQFRAFDPKHDSRHESRMGYQFGRRGYDMNGDKLPVVRVNWEEAKAFCNWLSKETGLRVDLPSEEQWEFASRAGTASPFWFGDFQTDFATFANMGDRRLKEFVACTAFENYTNVNIIENPNPFDDRFPKDERFDDGNFLPTMPGQYQPNPLGLFDMNGNVGEWTRCVDSGEKVVRGGSWFDRPYRCTNDYRLTYPAYQPVFNVGFRIAVEE